LGRKLTLARTPNATSGCGRVAATRLATANSCTCNPAFSAEHCHGALVASGARRPTLRLSHCDLPDEAAVASVRVRARAQRNTADPSRQSPLLLRSGRLNISARTLTCSHPPEELNNNPLTAQRRGDRTLGRRLAAACRPRHEVWGKRRRVSRAFLSYIHPIAVLAVHNLCY